MTEELFEDPTHKAFWDAARRGELFIQRCVTCGKHQFYGRPFCLACYSDDVRWIPARGTGFVYSMTSVRMELPGFLPPYTVAIVELDEGPRLTTNIVNGTCKIGERVRVAWRQRADNAPLPVFEPVGGLAFEKLADERA